MEGSERDTPEYRGVIDDIVHHAVSTYGTSFSGANARSIVGLTIYIYEKKRKELLLQQGPGEV